MKKLIVMMLMCSVVSLFSQVIALQGGESFALAALPVQLQVAMNQGENKTLTLEENLLSGYLWTARLSNPALQVIMTHQLQETTGGAPTMVGAMTAQIIGNVPGETIVDFVLCRAGDKESAPQATIRCQVLVAGAVVAAPQPILVTPTAPQPVVVAPAPQPVVVAPAPAPQPVVVAPAPAPQPVVVAPEAQPAVVVAPLPPPPPRPMELEHEYFYSLDQLPNDCFVRVRRDGGEIEFFLESKARDGYEWHALYDDDKLYVQVDNDYNDKVYLHGHKNKRSMRCTEIEITGRDRYQGRVILEYRRVRRGKAERPIKVVNVMVNVR